MNNIEQKYFLDLDDDYSIYKNYEVALNKYFFYSLRLSELAVDIEDGVIVDEDLSVGIIENTQYFSTMARKYKETLGNDNPIIDPYSDYNIRGQSFSHMNKDGNRQIIVNNAKTNIRLFTKIFDFTQFETSILALTIFE